ncbi:transcription factor Dp-1 [Nematocida sp. ERTm5]|nr:transcription factor Dp-1 [Nematocida sp. AWRm79]KAI5183454.1 transcription factor Dp-1 [Nematocida sp. AWRm78]OAG32381.1 transcription factor Dp-1 [Nematocida sp. ERTm5]
MNTRLKKERTGLKAFSAMILSIMQKEKSIEYTKVADIIMSMTEGTGDDKNVKRRVYDALNVMCAVNLIKKEKKMAYLTDDQLCSCEEEVEKRLATLGQSIVSTPKLKERVEEKKRVLEETIKRKELLLRLIRRNSEREIEEKEKLHLPFILISTQKKSRIDCETNDKRSYFKFIFTSPYKIYEDVHILKQIFGDKSISLQTKEHYPGQHTEQKENISTAAKIQNNWQKNKPDADKGAPGSPLGSSYMFTEDDDWLNLYNFLN